MPVIFLTILICIFNVFMWIVLLKKFKKIFSTEDIILTTREELNRMIEDVNRNTSRDLNLADEKIKEIEKVIVEAEKRLSVLNSDLAKQSQISEFKDALNQQKEETSYFSARKTPVEKYMQNKGSDINYYSNKIENNDDNIVVQEVKKEAKVLEMPTVTYSDEQITPKKDFAKSVKELYLQGLDVEFIARELNASTTEVQLIIDMNF